MHRFAILLCIGTLCACQPSKPPAPATNAPQPATQPLASSAPVAAADSSFVLPGDYAQATTAADLEARFGKANVQIVPDPDDPHRRSLVLFANDPSRRAYVTFHNDEALTDLAGIEVRDVDSRWRGKRGVRVGMAFSELRQLNGKPFYLQGFDSEHRAWVHDQWSPSLDDNDSQLGALDVEEEDHMYFGVKLGLRAGAGEVPASALPVDDSISSDDPRFPRLGELVVITAFDATTSLDDEWE
ncbi:MAG: hypothetical protein ACREPX_11090 [Rhodanobacteraceae bacterium]